MGLGHSVVGLSPKPSKTEVLRLSQTKRAQTQVLHESMVHSPLLLLLLLLCCSAVPVPIRIPIPANQFKCSVKWVENWHSICKTIAHSTGCRQSRFSSRESRGWAIGRGRAAIKAQFLRSGSGTNGALKSAEQLESMQLILQLHVKCT